MNYGKTSIATSHGSHSISIYIKASNSLVTSGTSSLGSITFSSLSISTIGTNQLIAKATDMLTDETSSFTIVALALTTIQMTTSVSSLSANEDFSISLELYDQRPVIWAVSSTVAVNGNLNIVGTSSKVTATGYATFTFYCTVPGTLTLTVTSGSVSTSADIEIKQQKLLITSSPPSVVNRYQRFTVRVTIYNNDFSTIESSHGPYTVQLSTTPSAKLLGIKTISSSSGAAEFTLIAFGTVGDFQLVASSSNIASATSSVVTVEYNYELGMEVFVPTYTPSAKYLYVFTATVTNITDLTPVTNTPVYLSINSSYFKSSNTDDDGVAFFKVIFNETGNHEMIFTCDIISKTEIVDVLQSNNSDEMCYQARNNETCAVCVENAYKVNGVCQCFEDAVFDPNTRKCVCPAGLTPSNGYCITCGNFYKRSEIHSEFSKDYLSVQVTFERAVKTAGLTSCSKIIKGPEYLRSKELTCEWQSGFVLMIYFEEFWDLQYEEIEIDNVNVQAIGDVCNFDIQKLEITVEQKYSVPVPQTELTGMSEYSLICGEKNLTVYASLVSKKINYIWRAVIEPENKKLGDFVEKTKGYLLDIPKKMLKLGTLEIWLTTQYLNLGTESVCFKKVKITNNRQISVSMNSPRIVYLKSSQSYTLIASVTEPCGSTSTKFTYKWSTQDPMLNLSSLSPITRPDMLEIPSYFLSASQTYNFSVTVSDNEVSGKAYSTIIIEESGLELTLSRSSGSVSFRQSLYIKANVLDPDDPKAKITKMWTCVEGVRFCKGREGNDLVLVQKDGELKVNNMRPLASYLFTVEAYTFRKKAMAFLNIFVDNSISGSVEMIQPIKKVDPDYVYNVLPKYNISGNPLFKWGISDPILNHSIINPKYSYAGFRENVLMPGGKYKLSLEVTSNDFKGIIKSFIEIKVNRPPQCEGITNLMIDDYLAFTSILCFDDDDEDYPLMYQYGYTDSEQTLRWLREISYEIKSYLIIPQDVKKMIARVCDFMETCKIYSSRVKIISTRRLSSDSKTISLYTRDPISIPNAVIVFSSTEIDDSDYLMIYDLMYMYFTSFSLHPHNFELYLGCLKAMISIKYKNFMILSNSTILSTLVLENMSRRVDHSKILELIEIYEPYLNFIEIKLIVDMISAADSVWSIDLTPIANFSSSSKVSIFTSKMNGKLYPDFSFSDDNISLLINSEDDYSTSQIYNLDLFTFKSNNTLVLSSQHIKSADYYNYSLSFTPISDSEITPSSPIQIILRNSLLAGAAKSSSSNCEIQSVNKTHIRINLSKFGVYEINEIPVPCSTSRVPMIVSGFFLIFYIAVAIGIYSVDYKYAYEQFKITKISVFFPITNLFVPQYNPRRMTSMSLIAAETMILLALIELSFGHIEFIEKYESPRIGDLNSKDIIRAFFALAITQFLSLINVGFKFYRRLSRRIEYGIVLVNFVICIISFIIIAITSISFCHKDLVGLFGIFTIDLFVQVLLIDLIYSILPVLILRENTVITNKVKGISKDFNASIRNFDLSSDNSGDARNTTIIATNQDKMNYEKFFYA